MKKLCMAIALCLICAITFEVKSQLQAQTVEEYAGFKEICRFGPDKNGAIRYLKGRGYVLCGKTDNQFEKTMASIFLGVTKESAILTLRDLRDLKDNIKEELVVTSGNPDSMTRIYFDSFYQLWFSTNGVAGSSWALTWLTEKNLKKITTAIQEFEE